MTTAQTKTTQIRLIYDFNNGKFSTVPTPLQMRRGQSVEFVSDQGSLDVLLEPAEAYQPSRFRTGDAPILVIKEAKGMIWCGGRFEVSSAGTLGNAQHITIDPTEKRFGEHNDPPLAVDGGGH